MCMHVGECERMEREREREWVRDRQTEWDRYAKRQREMERET